MSILCRYPPSFVSNYIRGLVLRRHFLITKLYHLIFLSLTIDLCLLGRSKTWSLTEKFNISSLRLRATDYGKFCLQAVSYNSVMLLIFIKYVCRFIFLINLMNFLMNYLNEYSLFLCNIILSNFNAINTKCVFSFN